ncbi:MAG TPA: MarR family transcriptional regulator [Jatrophihabitans sp.]|nr:MarR family transcriptional regulator [Jatrophihabitans sp.]
MSEADFAILVMGAARAVADRLDSAVERAGVDGMRPSFGFVIRALAERDRRLTELAELLAVTKQAAIKVVDEMERQGFVERVADPDDRRAKMLRLTPKGRQVRRAALAASRRMEAELRRDVGDETTAALRTALLAFLERHGALADAAAGRARALW